MKSRGRGRASQLAESRVLAHWLRTRDSRPPKQRVVFAWYTKESWRRLREIAADSEALDDSYEAWLASAKKAVAMLRARGVVVERVALDVDEVASWCAKKGRPFDSAARAAFLAEGHDRNT